MNDDPFDDFDDDQGFDLMKDDGWTNDDLYNRNQLDGEGRYRGPKDEQS